MENLQKIRILNAFRAYLHNMRTNDTNGNFRDKSISLKIRQVGRIFVVSLALITPTFVIYLSVWYLIENNLSISEFSTSIALILAYVQFNFNGVAMMIKRNMIHVTMDNIQKTVDEQCKNSMKSLRIYKRIEAMHTMLTRAIFFTIALLATTAFCLSLMFPISSALFGYPQPNQWRLLLEIHSLIDQNTYIEFLFNWCIESLSALCTANTFTAVTSLYVGLYLYIGGMLADLKAQMTSFDRKTTAESLEFRSIFVRAVQLHVDIIDHATATNNIMSEIIFIALLTNIIILAFNLYAVESNDLFSLEAIVGSLTIVGLLPLTFGYCYLAELMTSSLDDIGDIFYNSPWYELPAKQQKIVILPIQRTGREFSFQCLGLIDCSLVTFSSLIRSTCSYFIILRRFK